MEQNVAITHLDWTLIPLNRQKERCNNTWYDKENQRHDWWMFLLQPFSGNEFISLMKLKLAPLSTLYLNSKVQKRNNHNPTTTTSIHIYIPQK
jgi:hypothetical protein